MIESNFIKLILFYSYKDFLQIVLVTRRCNNVNYFYSFCDKVSRIFQYISLKYWRLTVTTEKDLKYKADDENIKA